MASTRVNPVDSLLWVWVTSPDVEPYWARTTRLLQGTPSAEKTRTLDQLRAGKLIAFEDSGMTIQCSPMATNDCKRLDHLSTFETGGFRLTSFRDNMALFHGYDVDETVEYFSMNEMAERGFMPTASIAANMTNVPVTTFDGDLLDVFVPIGEATLNFTKSYLSHA